MVGKKRGTFVVPKLMTLKKQQLSEGRVKINEVSKEEESNSGKKKRQTGKTQGECKQGPAGGEAAEKKNTTPGKDTAWAKENMGKGMSNSSHPTAPKK